MVRLVAVAVAALLAFSAPIALADGPLELLPSLAEKAAEQAQQKVQEVREVAERTAGDAEASLGDEAMVTPADAWNPSLDSLFAVVLGLAAAAAIGIVGGARFSTPAEVLQNPVRQRVFAYLRERTGATLKQITDDLALTTTNAIWHLRKLEDAGLIHSRRFNGFKVFYPAEGGIQARRLSLSMTALQNDNAQEVFEYVVANPGAHQREIARALQVNHGTVRWHLKKLRSAELLDEERRGKTSTYMATDIGRQALQNVKVQAPGPVIAIPPSQPLSS